VVHLGDYCYPEINKHDILSLKPGDWIWKKQEQMTINMSAQIAEIYFSLASTTYGNVLIIVD